MDSRCDVWGWNPIRSRIWQEFSKRRTHWRRLWNIGAADWAELILLSHVHHLEDEGKGNLTKKIEAEVAPVLLIWSSPLRTLPRMYADSTLWWAECAFSLEEKEHRADQKKKTSLLSPAMINQSTLRALKVIHKKKTASASMVGCHGAILYYFTCTPALMWSDRSTIHVNWLPQDQVCTTEGFTKCQSLKSGASILPRSSLKLFQAVLVFQSAFFKTGSSCCK